MSSNFFAIMSRMKYIERWALMRSSRAENLSEHSLETAMIAHMLCTIGNVRYGKDLDSDKAAVIGLYHDASEVITGDMPTPVKYYSDEIQKAYKDIEMAAQKKLYSALPDDIKEHYATILGISADKDVSEDDNDRYIRKIVKAADKLSALIKCIEEENAGNSEFKTALVTISESVYKMQKEVPEIKDFVKEFLPPYGRTLDELI